MNASIPRSTLRRFAATSARFGVRKGESAKEFAKRNPQDAMKLSRFVSRNMAALVREVSAKLA